VTESGWLRVGTWLLGIYWLVVAVETIPTVFLAAGTGTEPYAPKWLYVATPVLEAIVTGAAGLVLCIWSRSHRVQSPESTDHAAADSLVPPALQLLGVFTLVEGIRAFAGLGRRFSYREAWELEFGEMLNAAVALVLGLVLTLKASAVAALLRRYRRPSA